MDLEIAFAIASFFQFIINVTNNNRIRRLQERIDNLTKQNNLDIKE